MAKYFPSTVTRKSLICAAGSLFAEYGIDRVTTRDIAKAANENPGLIHYHFGSKGDLLDAALDFATAEWEEDPMGRYLKEHENCFETPEGQRKLVCGLIDLFIEMIFSADKPAWCGLLVFQIASKDNPASYRIYEKCVIPIMNTFHKVYSRISGNEDKTHSFCWTAMTIFPIHLLHLDQTITKRICMSESVPEPVLKTLRKMTIKSSLLNLGLWKESLENEFK